MALDHYRLGLENTELLRKQNQAEFFAFDKKSFVRSLENLANKSGGV